MNNNKKYSTKFSRITLSIGEEPFDYIFKRKDMHPSKIYLELQRIAYNNKLQMVTQRTIHLWLNKVNSNAA